MIARTTKNRFAYKLDKLFWFALMILPLVIYLVYWCRTSPVYDTYTEYGYDDSGRVSYEQVTHSETYPSSFGADLMFVMTSYGFSADTSVDFVRQTMLSIFGENGAFPLFDSYNQSIVYYLSYCVNIEIVHVLFDVLVFIPRLAHKWVGKAVQDG